MAKAKKRAVSYIVRFTAYDGKGRTLDIGDAAFEHSQRIHTILRAMTDVQNSVWLADTMRKFCKRDCDNYIG